MKLHNVVFLLFTTLGAFVLGSCGGSSSTTTPPPPAPGEASLRGMVTMIEKKKEVPLPNGTAKVSFGTMVKKKTILNGSFEITGLLAFDNYKLEIVDEKSGAILGEFPGLKIKEGVNERSFTVSSLQDILRPTTADSLSPGESPPPRN
jgi:hypothetical protein